MDALVAAARAAGVKDERVLAAIATVPRSGFVPSERAELANVDTPISIPHKQVTTQPSLVARMVEALAGQERVLEIGTGTAGKRHSLPGSHARCSASSALPISPRAPGARSRHARTFVSWSATGPRACRSTRPFDGIVVAPAYPQVPHPLADQLAEGGRLVQPLGFGGAEDVSLFEKRGGELGRVRSVSGAHFVRLHGRHGFS